MTQIVEELRRMTGAAADQYTIGETAYWTDEQLEGVLAQKVTQRLIQAPVERVSSIAEGGALEVRAGQVTVAGYLDAERAVVIDSTGAPVEGVTIHTDGRLDFATDQTARSLMLTGLVYDLNAAAADVLTDWAAAVKGGYDVTVDGQAMKRSQRHSQLLAQAQAFRSKAVAGSVRMRRSDQRPARPGYLVGRRRR